jgi:hypothetical protein
LRHEDLSVKPKEEFGKLYEEVNLPFDAKVERGIKRATKAENPSEISLKSIYSTNLNSAANLENWKKRLSKEEIKRIRKSTQDVARHFYSDEDWK